MKSPSSRESLQALPDWSAVPSDSEEDRKLVGQRIAFFGLVVGLISGSFYLFNLLLGIAINPEWLYQVRHIATMMHLAAVATFFAMWLACRKGRRSSLELNVINVGGLALSSIFYALMIGLAPGSDFTQALILALIIVSTLNTHAIIVPATERRMLWVSALTAAPVPITTYMITDRNPQLLAGMSWAAFAAAAFVTLWCVTGVATSTLASRIIYGLQQRVRAATELGQYTLEEKIGEGGMGAVYRARHALLRRPTAIKLLTNGRGDERQVRRFEREVQLTASLTHPNTIAIYDFGHTPDGIFYYAMEFLEGITLEELVEHEGPQPAGRVVHLLQQVCAALVEAHQLGLVHRDIKPANIMLSLRGAVPDHVKVLDFGLVKEVADQSPNTTAQNTLLGTPLYLAPEAITSPDAVGPATDLYAVGAVAYQLLTGHPPFEGQTIVEVCSKHLLAEPVALSAHAGIDVPPALEQLVLACLAKSPEARPDSAATVRDRLEAITQTLASRWTATEARRWWETRAPAIVSSAQHERRKSRRSASPATIAIDLAARSLVPSTS
jgi:eukaryotic-like serine/threonine-protein kinase